MIDTNIKNIDLTFETEASVFSPNSIDRGTLAMLSVIDFLPSDKVLDLGCGYGVVGILAGKLIGEENVTMCDVSEQAIECAKKNTVLNGVGNINIILGDAYENVEEKDFTIILSNPPYHADFSVPKKFIPASNEPSGCLQTFGDCREGQIPRPLGRFKFDAPLLAAGSLTEIGFKKLTVGGKLVMVTKRLDWYKNKLTSIFGGVKVQEVDGYYVFVAEKRNHIVKNEKTPKNRLSKKLQRKNNRLKANHHK